MLRLRLCTLRSPVANSRDPCDAIRCAKMTSYSSPTQRKKPRSKPSGIDALNRIVENDLIRRVSDDEYRAKIKDVYGGPKGAMLATCSMLSLHIPLGERLFRTRRFDLRGMKSILDVGSGAGQIAKHLLEYSRSRRADHVHRSVAPDAAPGPQAAEERPAGVRGGRPVVPAVCRRVVRRRHVRLRARTRARSAARACARWRA